MISASRVAPLDTDRRPDAGFSLLEVVVAMSILVIGLLGLAQTFYVGMSLVGTSSPNLIAREKAREAIESVHTARDTRVIQWAEIRNVGNPDCAAWPNTVPNGGGRFLGGELPMQTPGPDGLVNTADDVGVEASPGPDNILGTGDDLPLTGFTRQVVICDVQNNPDLRQVIVTIRYNGTGAIGQQRREYRLVTFVSRFS
jgi:prepilin-type N-terminal cleavage/methylation domain-containing protein